MIKKQQVPEQIYDKTCLVIHCGWRRVPRLQAICEGLLLMYVKLYHQYQVPLIVYDFDLHLPSMIMSPASKSFADCSPSKGRCSCRVMASLDNSQNSGFGNGCTSLHYKSGFQEFL